MCAVPQEFLLKKCYTLYNCKQVGRGGEGCLRVARTPDKPQTDTKDVF